MENKYKVSEQLNNFVILLGRIYSEKQRARLPIFSVVIGPDLTPSANIFYVFKCDSRLIFCIFECMIKIALKNIDLEVLEVGTTQG